MNHALPHKIVLGLGLLSLSTVSFADDLSVTLSSYALSSPYKNTSTKVRVLPDIDYEHDRFFFHGLTGGIHLAKTQHQSFNLFAAYVPQEFKPRDSDNAQMRALDSRQSTVMTGVSYDAETTSVGAFHAQLMADLLARSKGLSGDMNYTYPLHMQHVEVVPGIGTLWNSQKQNAYYYGVSGNEASRSGLSAYTPASGFMPYAEVTAVFPVTQHLYANVMGRYIMLPDTVKDSPMVNKSGTAILGAGVGYHF